MGTFSAGDTEVNFASDLLAEKLSNPVTATALASLIDQAGILAFLLQAIDEFLSRGDEIADSLAVGLGQVRSITSQGGRSPARNLSEIASNFSKLTVSLSESSPAIAELLDSGMFRSDVVQLLSAAADAAVEARRNAASKPPKVQGAYSLVKSLKDPEVQKGFNYMVELAGALGRRV